MLDKGDFRVRAGTKFSKEFEAAIASQHGDSKWRSSKAYRRSGDFRELGFDCIVHTDCKLTRQPNHKVEILSIGEKTYSGMVELLGRVFDTQAEILPFVRADLTADVNDVPVPWFHQHCYMKHKRIHRVIGEIPANAVQLVRNMQAQTLYGGKMPNLYRIYDKAGERAHRYRAMQRSTERAHKEWVEVMTARRVPMKDPYVVPEPFLESYETMFGHSALATITRVERQCHGKDLEKLGITNLESFKVQGRYMRPFTALQFITEKMPEKNIKRWGTKDEYIGKGIQEDIRNYGWDWTRLKLKADQGDNLWRFVARYQPFIREALLKTEINFTAQHLQVEYERSTYLQMAA
jgi:hypothetical protein